MRAMLIACAALLALPVLAQTPAAGAVERKLTLLVTGDNRGEIAPCG